MSDIDRQIIWTALGVYHGELQIMYRNSSDDISPSIMSTMRRVEELMSKMDTLEITEK